MGDGNCLTCCQDEREDFGAEMELVSGDDAEGGDDDGETGKKRKVRAAWVRRAVADPSSQRATPKKAPSAKKPRSKKAATKKKAASEDEVGDEDEE